MFWAHQLCCLPSINNNNNEIHLECQIFSNDKVMEYLYYVFILQMWTLYNSFKALKWMSELGWLLDNHIYNRGQNNDLSQVIFQPILVYDQTKYNLVDKFTVYFQ